MKKVLGIMMLMLLFTSSAYAAASFSLTGEYWASGRWWDNYDAAHDQTADFGYVEQDINLFPKITLDNTSLNFKIAITDMTWGDKGDGSNFDNQTGNLYSQGTSGAAGTSGTDNNIAIERAYMTHKFNDIITLDVGLMDGAVWGTSFAERKEARWRVKLTEITKAGAFVEVYEKNTEYGYANARTGAVNEDKDDGNSYGLGYIGKAGPITFKQLIFFVNASNYSVNQDYRGYNQLYLALALNGDLGAVAFESELGYRKHALTEGITGASVIGGAAHQDDQNWRTYGAYLNVWAKALNAMTPGMVLAYGSYEDDLHLASAFPYQGFDFGDDFNSTLILGDEMNFGDGGSSSIYDLYGMSMIKLYVNDIKTPVKKLTLNGYYAYIRSNQGNSETFGAPPTVFDGVITDAEKNIYKKAHAWEAGVGATYQITNNLSYSPYAAYASITYNKHILEEKFGAGSANDVQPAPILLFGNDITFSF